MYWNIRAFKRVNLVQHPMVRKTARFGFNLCRRAPVTPSLLMRPIRIQQYRNLLSIILENLAHQLQNSARIISNIFWICLGAG